jgi:hypothetical protein
MFCGFLDLKSFLVGRLRVDLGLSCVAGVSFVSCIYFFFSFFYNFIAKTLAGPFRLKLAKLGGFA